MHQLRRDQPARPKGKGRKVKGGGADCQARKSRRMEDMPVIRKVMVQRNRFGETRRQKPQRGKPTKAGRKRIFDGQFGEAHIFMPATRGFANSSESIENG